MGPIKIKINLRELEKRDPWKLKTIVQIQGSQHPKELPGFLSFLGKVDLTRIILAQSSLYSDVLISYSCLYSNIGMAIANKLQVKPSTNLLFNRIAFIKRNLSNSKNLSQVIQLAGFKPCSVWLQCLIYFPFRHSNCL